MKKGYFLVGLGSIFLGTLVLTGCPPKKKIEIQDQSAVEEVKDSVDDLMVNMDGSLLKEDVVINQDWTDVPALTIITFDYDASQLNAMQREALKANVAILKKLPESVKIRVAGHCDDRGTIEYNIALGQRRAQVVKSFYATAGINSNRLSTISFGEERPTCTQESETCWAKNRRAVTNLRNSEALTIKAGEF